MRFFFGLTVLAISTYPLQHQKQQSLHTHYLIKTSQLKDADGMEWNGGGGGGGEKAEVVARVSLFSHQETEVT